MPRFRRATLDDADAVAALAAMLIRQAYEDLIPGVGIEAYIAQAFSTARVKSDLADETIVTLLAEDEDTGNAVALTQLRSTQVPVPSPIDANVELWRFYLERSWHGSGLAQRFMHEAGQAAAAMDAHGVWLSVWEDNPRAIRFYEKVGFMQVGFHEFPVGETAYRDAVMCIHAADLR